MELFREDGCFSEEGLDALLTDQLDELGRLEAAEHLAYCDRCMDRYTERLTADIVQEPPQAVRGPVMTSIWVRLMQNTYGRTAVASVAAVLALTMWRNGIFVQILQSREQIKTWMPSTSEAKPIELPQKQPELLGKPIEDDAPSGSLYNKIAAALEEYFTSDADQKTEKK